MLRNPVAKGGVLAVAVLLCVRMAASQQPPHEATQARSASPADVATGEREALSALQQEVKTLQDELTRVREQLDKVDTQLERLHAGPSGEPAPAEARASTGAEQSTPSSCTPPYEMVDGIKRFRPACLARPMCDPPYFVDKGGIRRFREECMTPAADSAQRCSPPYSLLEDGTRRFKPQCL